VALSAYKHPPITEAVIGITFETPIGDAEILSVQEKFAANYPQHQRLSTLNLKVNVNTGSNNKATTAVDEEVGHRRATSDMTQLLVFMPATFLISQLAPYPGWDEFFSRFARDWKQWNRYMGFRQIKRVGVRYINRIDIPVSGPILEHEEYLNVFPKVPDNLGPITAYGVQTTFMLEDIGCNLSLNSAAVPSPLLNHASFLIDQDINKEIDPPQSEKDIHALLQAIRLKKNQIFEDCVSDRSRELFNYG
jgi:uncharacterized protein (TIGR04255 family)